MEVGFCFLLILAALIVKSTKSSKILALMTVSSHSHHHFNVQYLNALIAKGHNITYLGVDDYKNPPANLRYIKIENVYELNDVTANITEMSGEGPFKAVYDMYGSYDKGSRNVVAQDGFKEFLRVIKSEDFDLVVYDLVTTHFILGAVDVVGRPPVVGITAFGTPPWAMEYTGTPYPIPNNPHHMLPSNGEMNVWDRLWNGFFFLYAWCLREYHLGGQDALSKKVFGSQVRSIREIENDITINLVNSNWATDNPYPVAPGLIPVGGLHIGKVKPLPQDLQKFLDSSTDGVIYFSLGSNIQSTYLQEKEINILTSAFKQLAPIKVLWKWEKDELPGKPDNVKVGKWLPQNDILAHSNVKLFFTHGGLLSSQEALFHGVPTVGMPVFLDQHLNIEKAQKLGFGEIIRLNELETELVVKNLKKVLNNSSYKKKVMELSHILRDQINTPLETAVYWTEYAIRHKGAPHLQPPSKKLNWFQAQLLDLIFIVLVGLFVVYKILEFLVMRPKTPKLKRQ